MYSSWFGGYDVSYGYDADVTVNVAPETGHDAANWNGSPASVEFFRPIVECDIHVGVFVWSVFVCIPKGGVFWCSGVVPPKAPLIIWS